jgi:hypothetical protein
MTSDTAGDSAGVETPHRTEAHEDAIGGRGARLSVCVRPFRDPSSMPRRSGSARCSVRRSTPRCTTRAWPFDEAHRSGARRAAEAKCTPTGGQSI